MKLMDVWAYSWSRVGAGEGIHVAGLIKARDRKL